MKPKCRLSALAAALALAGGAHASNVTVYGNLDAAVRHSTNIDGNNKDVTELVSGGLTASKWGFKGSEDLGGDLRAVFQLESGIGIDTGQGKQQNVGSNTLFGRQAYVGLTGDFGSLTFGRQYNALNVAFDYQPIGGIYYSDPFFVGGDNFFMGYRINNSVVYAKSFGALSVQLDYGFGERGGSGRNGATYGASLAYVTGPLNLGGAYEQARAVDGATTAKTWTGGGGYAIGPAKLYLGHLHNREEGASERSRKMTFGGVSYQATPALSLSGGYYSYRQSDCAGVCVVTPGSASNVSGGMGSNAATGFATGAGRGKADIVALVANYALSKRTSVYLEADRTDARDGAARDDVNYWWGDSPRLSKLRRTGVMVGLRQSF
ncbi:putative porin [Janthinobacterium sp. CG_23.3]|uniref:porin n=1 Tax=Janthinobacterium sp. CG_23.3 TaxID=3349634 RepID=UPI0038D3FEAD